VLSVTSEGDCITLVPVRPGDTVEVSFVHSAEGDGRLRPLQTSYSSYGAGLEATATPDKHRVPTKERTLILRVNREPLREILFRTQWFTGHRLAVRDTLIPLSPPAGPSRPVSIAVKTIPWWKYQ